MQQDPKRESPLKKMREAAEALQKALIELDGDENASPEEWQEFSYIMSFYARYNPKTGTWEKIHSNFQRMKE